MTTDKLEEFDERTSSRHIPALSKVTESYCRLLIFNIVALSITCTMLMVSMVKLDHVIEQQRESRREVIRYLNEAETDLTKNLDNQTITLKNEIKEDVQKIIDERIVEICK